MGWLVFGLLMLAGLIIIFAPGPEEDEDYDFNAAYYDAEEWR